MIKIALAQIDTELGNKEENLLKIKSLCLQASTENVDIICFPELATTGYSPELLGTQLWSLSESCGGKTDKLLSKLSTQLNLTIICGFVERGCALGKIYNSAGIWIPNNKSWIGTFQKIHLINHERSWFTSGREITIFNTPKCQIGIMICHDVGFPELSRILALKGADILFIPAAWHKEAKDIWVLSSSSRALDNGIHLAAVNRWGIEKDLHFFGGSQVINARGQILKKASESGEDMIYCDIDFDLQAKTRLEIQYLKDRRTDIYSINYKNRHHKNGY